MRLGGLYTFKWGKHVKHAPWRGLGACISCARVTCTGARMSCHRRMHASKCLPWPAVFTVCPLCVFELFMCMYYDWGITLIVHVHRGPSMFKVQVIICSYWTGGRL